MLCLVLLAGYGGSLCGGAGAGPNPGAGFYGAPNINTGLLTLEKTPSNSAARAMTARRFRQDAPIGL